MNRFRTYAYAYPPNSNTWKTSMQVVQTLGLPPNHGKMYLAMIGCTWKSKNALTKIVVANKKNVNRFKGIEFTEVDSVAKRKGVNRTCDPQVQNPTPKSEPSHLSPYLSERKDERIACTLSTITIAPSEPPTRSILDLLPWRPRPVFVHLRYAARRKWIVSTAVAGTGICSSFPPRVALAKMVD